MNKLLLILLGMVIGIYSSLFLIWLTDDGPEQTTGGHTAMLHVDGLPIELISKWSYQDVRVIWQGQEWPKEKEWECFDGRLLHADPFIPDAYVEHNLAVGLCFKNLIKDPDGWSGSVRGPS